MNILSSIFLSVAAFFGFQVAAEPVVSQPYEAQEAITLDASAAVSGQATTSTSDSDITSEETSKEVTNDTTPVDSSDGSQTMMVAGGCFWCVEADLEKLPGVTSVVSGYAGGDAQNPTYQNYSSGGHREVVLVTYNPATISFEEILIVTMKTTDPTDDDGTFGDRGDEYSSAFFYENEDQKRIIENLIYEVDEYGPYDSPLEIDVEERVTFWPAEDYHQDYYKGPLTRLKYQYYRTASGRNTFIDTYWGTDGYTADLPWRNDTSITNTTYMWENYQKPTKEELKTQLDPIAFKVTQEDGTERAGTSPLDKNWEEGIYVDILSGEPLYSSKDKFDSGTGWPSFVKPITDTALTEHEDRKLFSVRTETRSAIADNHLGHVFTDGPADRGGLRYCMNGAALEFVPRSEMVERGYEDFLQYL
jgi:peptide methionine sulfoxide reductase msrA/msrB